MKLNIVKASTGLLWFKQGFRTFFKQPLAMAGLFFMFMALLSLATMVPVIGFALALLLLPAATLGLMVATEQAADGKFPMPTVLIAAFRAGRERLKDMMVLGAIYALLFMVVLGISALIDGGGFAKLYLGSGKLTEEVVMQPNFQIAMWVMLALYLPLSLMFWHAPALVHWHGVSPAKSLFFSLMACYKNFGAMTVFGLTWLGTMMGAMFIVTVISAVLGNAEFGKLALFPLLLIMMTAFFTSIYFTFRDSFVTTPDDAPDGVADASPGETP